MPIITKTESDFDKMQTDTKVVAKPGRTVDDLAKEIDDIKNVLKQLIDKIKTRNF